ncbi:bromodomain adjacent to zinc finger domain protein 1A-like [Hyposmocoma kahamanoa]|uniref:bromodomain adjacent to zinc finger domain protein 1A-like n=1 Tax=Hyposmocoma kahamanoa TaxID=1477025 RepID=UPI000E6D9013|nr:bromodomain adjacent to zinc finger domain protein 1A-like [Hyposmocoma kahamanoa]
MQHLGSDKENDSAANSRGNSPKKPLTNLNGLTQKLNGLESNTQQYRELLVCTGDISTCFVHGKGDFRPHWRVYHTEEQIEALIQSLNKRGVRESELRQALELDKANIVEYVKKCPLHHLNPDIAPPPPVHHMTRNKKFTLSLVVPDDSTLSEALELSLRDHILELEEKIFHGCLGALKVKDREAWRGTLMLRGYDKQADYLSWGPNKQYRDDYHLPNGVLKVPNDIDKSEIPAIPENKYRDPGQYLEAPKVNGVKTEPEDTGAKPDVIRSLASALLQVSQSIHHKYIKRPLGLDDKERKDREARNKPLDLEALERWEVSLMECKSFAAVVLHLFTLDSSITWSASILNASCRLCRRKTDPDNMLLCDGCNKGHHLYCLKPKLTKVPHGDWFCDQCKPKERTPRKRRKLFSDEYIEEALNSDDESFGVDAGVCGSCGSGGRLAAECISCRNKYHTECAAPKPGRTARRWTCASCLAPTREHTIRRCAATAISNIHQYTRALDSRRNSSDSDDSEYNTVLVKLKTQKRDSKEASPVANGLPKKRGRKSKEETITNSRKSRTSLANGVHEEHNTSKKRSSRLEAQTPLHVEALQILLRDVMKHKDCWPFYEPVSIEDVPDYLDVIEKPMDFSTIREKLELGDYNTDQELIGDAALVLVNCFTYNKDTHPVAKAGVRLERYINKRCAELELPPLPEINLDQDNSDSDSAQKRRVSEHQDAPKAKKAKFK